MRAWNRKRKKKHTTRIKWIEFWGTYFFENRNTKAKSETDDFFGDIKFRAYSKY